MKRLLCVLSEDERAQVHKRSLWVLQHTGLRVETTCARQILRHAGAQFDDNGDIVGLKKETAEESLWLAPKEFSHVQG